MWCLYWGVGAGFLQATLSRGCMRLYSGVLTFKVGQVVAVWVGVGLVVEGRGTAAPTPTPHAFCPRHALLPLL